ncbi:hypothetical protein C7S14_4379 [Burkholderia cepacia]|nr:hypothetical protein C7S14_4379 [Burkholderia cepacia]
MEASGYKKRPRSEHGGERDAQSDQHNDRGDQRSRKLLNEVRRCENASTERP